MTWKVEGVVVETATAAPGETVERSADYAHGVTDVEVVVGDGVDETSSGTTVTVQDTAAPILIVAQDVVVATDPGESFASNVILPPPTATGHEVTLENDAPPTYPIGETIVTWTAEDEEGNVATGMQKVVVEDREKPTLAGIATHRLFVDRGKLFSTFDVPSPAASDNVTDAAQLVVTSDELSSYPIGNTTVMFRTTDGARNQTSFPVTVTVVNRRPIADAGNRVVAETQSEKGARLRLDGRGSSDPDGHKLTYRWSAPGVRFENSRSSRPFGFFPVGATTVKLVVTDAAGASRSATVRVNLKLKGAKPRSQGAEANRSFSAAVEQTAGASNVAASSALVYAGAATALGGAAGEYVRWEDGQSEADAHLAYAELRRLQHAYGEAAAGDLFSAYAETGDEALFSACVHALYGAACASADLSEP